ncbi:MAG TPA: hypothetical protein VH092_23705 [Urbifossiella sp.]|nr:hypothetical protein [Urbifossiella sp.]
MARHRYFFTDPISAVWMVKAFRFKVMAGSFCIQPESVDAFFELLGSGTRHDKYEVHPESIPLLEPKPGDVVEEAGARTKLKKLVPANFPLTGTGCVILQRSGRPFFTPIKEG